MVVSDVEIESEYQFERRMFGSNPDQLRSLAGKAQVGGRERCMTNRPLAAFAAKESKEPAFHILGTPISDRAYNETVPGFLTQNCPSVQMT